jgi:hypothetical protein
MDKALLVFSSTLPHGDRVSVGSRPRWDVGAALGAQAGEAKLREVITAGGFRNARRAAETPFNMILEARP